MALRLASAWLSKIVFTSLVKLICGDWIMYHRDVFWQSVLNLCIGGRWSVQMTRT
jgi:hypothetical protein